MCSTAAPLPFHSVSISPAHPSSCRQSYSQQTYQRARTPKDARFDIGVGAALRRTGLHTPPIDAMSATYHAPPLVAYDSHVLPSYPSTVAQARGKAVVVDVARAPQYPRYPPVANTYSQSQSVANPASATSQYSTASKRSTRPSTPTSGAASETEGTSSLILHSLQIPSCINPKGGNIADFAAQITCLFWFESMETLRAAEKIRSRPSNAPVPRLTEHAIPFPQFKKWAYSVLATTQVTPNVILLALLFVYRLKTTNPAVKGRSGSEYRLLTVALMLGNKFLDDNTYTNKTWAEVSGITVQEIHVMEVEFLSNMRYSLLATKEEWEEWLVKLACFSEYYERAQRQPTSPLAKAYTSPTTSPTSAVQPAASFPPLTPSGTTVYSPSTNIHANAHAWPSTYQNPQVSPLSGKHAGVNGRKRTSEGDIAEPPAKRLSRQPGSIPPVVRPPVVGEQPMRLPVPNLTLNTNPAPSQLAYPPTTTYATQPHVSLPPLGTSVRAMATVFPPTAATTSMPQLPMPATTSMPQASLTPSTVSMHPVLGYGTPTKRHSPGSNLSVYASSPLGEQFPPSAMHTPISHTPISHSPSVYLQQRPSPYKPIRHVNTLLYPPPSASLNEYHLPTTQMHYQPLGRRNDLRTGVVPEFMNGSYRLSHQQFAQMVHGPHQGSYPN